MKNEDLQGLYCWKYQILFSFAPKVLVCQRRKIAAAAGSVRCCEPAEAKGTYRAKSFPQLLGPLADAQAGWNEKLSVSLSDEIMTRPVERARWDWAGICTMGNMTELRVWWQGRVKHTLKLQDSENSQISEAQLSVLYISPLTVLIWN